MRRGFKVLMWVVLGPVVLLLLLVVAWVASNGRWADAAPQPVPPELMPQQVTLPAEANAFFDAQGLLAPLGELPNAWGQRAWRGETAADAQRLSLPTGELWTCNPTKVDCVANWQASADALIAQRAAAKVFGERCTALAGRADYQEPVQMRLAHAQGADVVVPYALPQFGPVSTCLRWLQMEAVLASDARQAHVAWERADAFIRHVAAGAQTLIGQAIAWSWITRHQVLLAQWAARQPPGDGALPAAWLKPYPERILQPRFWMAAESHFGRETTADIGNRSEAMFGAEPNPLQRWAGLLSLGYLPELTRQMLDEQWLAQVRAQGELQGAALARSARSEPEPEPETMSGWSAMRWRNTVGGILVDVARPHFRPYVLRQADVALYQTALGLSQQLNGLPAAERLARLQGQALEVGIRERLSLEGDALLIRTWRGDAEPAESAPVRFPLRPA